MTDAGPLLRSCLCVGTAAQPKDVAKKVAEMIITRGYYPKDEYLERIVAERNGYGDPRELLRQHPEDGQRPGGGPPPPPHPSSIGWILCSALSSYRHCGSLLVVLCVRLI